MNTGVWVAVIASATSLSVALTTARSQRRSAREAREEQRQSDAKVVLDKYRGPLLAAAFELGRRIDNIRNDNFLGNLGAGGARERHARLTTLFRFAQYFGWREILRTEVQLLRFEREGDTQLVALLINDIDWAFGSDSLGEPETIWEERIWAEEQRAIGELMICRNQDGSAAVRGYATFVSEYDETFAPWMNRLEAYVLSKDATSSRRLLLVEWALLGLVARLDDEDANTRETWMARAEEELEEDLAHDAPRIDQRIRTHARRAIVDHDRRSRSLGHLVGPHKAGDGIT
jgi:hypothetical protein